MAAKAAPPDVTDAQLIARCIVGDDRHAFAELVKRHQSAVRACLRKLTTGNHGLADDLAQDTFVLAWRNLEVVSAGSPVLDVALSHRDELLACACAEAPGGTARGPR